MMVSKYTIVLYYTMTVLLEYIDCLLQFFTNAWYCYYLFYTSLVCLMLSMAYYAQNYAGIIGRSLIWNNSRSTSA